MPDTGAPHFIPFLDGTELVRAYPDFSEDLADAVAAGLSAAGNAGIGSNVVQAVVNTPFSTTSNTYVDITGAEVTITPTSATSKVLVCYTLMAGNSDATNGAIMAISRGSTVIFEASANNGSSGMRVVLDDRLPHTFAGMFLDSPESAAPTTYNLVGRRTGAGSSPAVFGGRGDGGGETPMQIIAIEVAA